MRFTAKLHDRVLWILQSLTLALALPALLSTHSTASEKDLLRKDVGVFLTQEAALSLTRSLGARGRIAYIESRTRPEGVAHLVIYVVVELYQAESPGDQPPRPATMPGDEGYTVVATLTSSVAAERTLKRLENKGVKAFVIETQTEGGSVGYSIVIDPNPVNESPPAPPPETVSLEAEGGIVLENQAAPPDQAAPPMKKDSKATSFEYELNPYYSNADIFLSLTNTPIPEAGERSELQIYRDLFLSSYIPRFLVLEASIYPMPLLGVVMKDRAPSLYESGKVGNDLNIWQAITEGFEEPWAVSLFLGNVMNFKRSGRPEHEGGNKGFMGYLFSVGNLHIKDNELINDYWQEVEWKVKGDRDYPLNRLSWSFRVGAKFHDNPDITDVYYISLKRSRLDFKAETHSILKNSAFEYTFLFTQEDMAPVQHTFFIEKKFPQKSKKYAYTLALGVVYDKDRKYTGDLDDRDGDSYSLIIRPNIEF